MDPGSGIRYNIKDNKYKNIREINNFMKSYDRNTVSLYRISKIELILKKIIKNVC